MMKSHFFNYRERPERTDKEEETLGEHLQQQYDEIRLSGLIFCPTHMQ